MKTQSKLLARDEFRNAVFVRDAHRCVMCGAAAADAHHILERRLWIDSGYYLDNGASVCGPCHMLAEQTLISCEDLREKCGIKNVLLPEHLYRDENYDKWGNPCLPNGMRLKGELFFDESVQKVLEPVLHLFTDRVKYPRTFHLPWSPGATKDDKIMPTLEAFVGQEVIVTEKLDGENTSFYPDGMHARSLTYEPHASRDRVRALHAQVASDIPPDHRLCGENVVAKHSIHYRHLSDFFLMFSMWRQNVCLSWDETTEWADLIGLRMVPVIYEGLWDEKLIRTLAYKTSASGDEMEGYVVRLRRAFTYSEFRRCVGKYVRAGHVTSSHHWKHEALVLNGVEK